MTAPQQTTNQQSAALRQTGLSVDSKEDHRAEGHIWDRAKESHFWGGASY